MMWILLLGLWIVMAASLGSASRLISRLFEKARHRALGRNEEKNLPVFFLRTLLLVLTSPQEGAARAQAAYFQNLRLRTWRANVLWAALGSFAMWFPLAVVLSLHRMSGLFLVAFAGILLFAGVWVRVLRGIGGILLCWGAFFFLLENALRGGASLVAGEASPFVQFLADGRPGPVLILFAAGLLLSALLRFPFLFFSAALLLLSAGWMSLSGAVALWLGERVGLGLALWLRGRSLREGPRRILAMAFRFQIGGALVGLLLVGFARDGMGFSALGGNGIFEILSAFAALSVLAELPFFLLFMARAHFEAKLPPDDLFQKGAPMESWLGSSGLSPDLLRSALQGIEARLGLLRSMPRELSAEDWQKIPVGVRSASADETKELERHESFVKAHLLSGTSCFQDPLR